MEIVTLNEDFQSDDLVENYETSIWTERYSTAGDFQITFNDIAFGLQKLPAGSYISLRESTVPMRVMTRQIDKKKNSVPVLTVTGKAFESYALGNRQAVNSLPSGGARAAWVVQAGKESDAAYKAIRTVIGDIERFQALVSVLTAVSPAVDPLDAIPEVDLILPQDYSTATTNNYEIAAGKLYDTIMTLVTTNNHGIKSIRPIVGETQVGIEIYNGADQTDIVVFDARFDQIDDATYLLSDEGEANVGYVYGPNGSQKVLKTAGPEPSGLDRKVLLVDGAGSTVDTRKNQGLVELYKNNATALFDGQVAEQVAQGYNRDYFLGDILKLVGQYGLSENVRVAEFIRSSDNSGEKAYPTFEAVTS